MLLEEKIDLYEYFGLKRKGGERGYISTYVLENNDEFAKNRLRPAMVVFPGGGYWCCSSREGEPVALSYLSHGFQSFVVEYTTTDVKPDAKFPLMLIEACMAVAYVRINADKYNVNPEKIAVCGFSAGGHLVGSLSTMYDDVAVIDALKENAKFTRPDSVVLCYPVITFVGDTHIGTRDNATGGDESKREILSVENRVTKNTPPTFIWTTSEDKTVPPTNSLRLATALSENSVPFELHVYERGYHGLSLANEEVALSNVAEFPELEEWLVKSVQFLKRRGFLPITRA